MEKARKIGMDAYNAQQREKGAILRQLLASYNDGRRKTFFCVAINLLDLQDIKDVMEQTTRIADIDKQGLKEKSAFVAGLFQEKAREKGLELKLRRKK